MTVNFELPIDIEKILRQELGNLDQVAKEAALVELYRQDQLTQHELAAALGITRLEMEAVLKKHNVIEDLPSLADYEVALTSLREMTVE